MDGKETEDEGSSFEIARKRIKIPEGAKSVDDNGEEWMSSSSMFNDSEASERDSEDHGFLSTFYARRGDSKRRFRIEDILMERRLRMQREDHRVESGTKRESKLQLLVEEFFSALDKFVSIANYCMKNVEVGDTDEDFNFALSWIRHAFHWLGVEGAKHYAGNPGLYNGWSRDIGFLMNRYFFSPEFNHVNGLNIEESVCGGYQFVENARGGYSLVYVPFPGYYDSDNRQFCPGCSLALPAHLRSCPDK